VGLDRILLKFQADTMGMPLKAFVLDMDWAGVKKHLHSKDVSECSILFRLKSALTPKGERSRKLTTALVQVRELLSRYLNWIKFSRLFEPVQNGSWVTASNTCSCTASRYPPTVRRLALLATGPLWSPGTRWTWRLETLTKGVCCIILYSHTKWFIYESKVWLDY